MKELNLSLTISADGKAAVTAISQVNKAVHNCITQTDRLAKYFYLLQNAVMSFKGALASMNAVFHLTDEIKQTEARLKIATGTQSQFNQALKESQQIAKNARVDFLSTVNLFSRLSTAAKQYGIEQSKISKVTEAVTYGLKLYGASTAEVASVQTQLSQALASGTLAGDEFKSMAEASPRLMQALAEGLGVARSELKKLASDGKLTTKIVVDALAKQSQNLKQEFTRMPLTVSEALGQIKNSIVQLTKEADQSTGFSQKISQRLLVINAHFKTLSKSLATVGVMLFSMWASQKLITYTRALRGLLSVTRLMTGAQVVLNSVMRANPIGIIITTISTAISVLTLFGDSITPISGKLATLKDYALVVWDSMVSGIKMVIQFLSKIGSKITAVFTKVKSGYPVITQGLNTIVTFAQTALNHFIGLHIGAFKVITQLFKKLPDVIENVMAKAYNTVISTLNNLIKGTSQLLNHLPGINLDINEAPFKQLEIQGQQTALNLSETFKEAFNQDYVGGLAEQVAGLGAAWQNRAEQKHQERENENNPTNDAQVESLSKLTTQATLTKEALKELQKVKDFKQNQETNLADYAFETSLIGQQADTVEKLRFEYDLQKQAQQAMIGLSERNKAAIEAEVQAIKEKHQALANQRQAAQDKHDGSAFGGMMAGLKSVGDKAGTVFGTMKKASESAMTTMADGIANMVVSGKANFKDLTKSILADIAKMLIQMALLKAVKAAVGMFADGGSFDSSGQMALAKGGAFNAQGVKYYARGDIFNSPTMFAHAGGLGVMGEAGPEAVMPLTRGPNGKLGVKLYNDQKRQALAGQVNNIEITVNVADGKSETAQKSTQESRQLAEKLQMAVRQVLSQEMRPGGMLGAR